jgi:hypothetical protein
VKVRDEAADEERVDLVREAEPDCAELPACSSAECTECCTPSNCVSIVGLGEGSASAVASTAVSAEDSPASTGVRELDSDCERGLLVGGVLDAVRDWEALTAEVGKKKSGNDWARPSHVIVLQAGNV